MPAADSACRAAAASSGAVQLPGPARAAALRSALPRSSHGRLACTHFMSRRCVLWRDQAGAVLPAGVHVRFTAGAAPVLMAMVSRQGIPPHLIA